MSTGIAEEEGAGEGWTDEKHTSFLNWMEDSFVTCMLLGGRFAYATGDSRRVAAPPPPLDRYLPDGADSTLDHPTDKRARRTAAQPPREGRRGTCDRETPLLLLPLLSSPCFPFLRR